VESVRADADNWSILFMHLFDLPDIGSLLGNVIVKLVPGMSASLHRQMEREPTTTLLLQALGQENWQVGERRVCKLLARRHKCKTQGSNMRLTVGNSRSVPL
jgi:hypothetical protein